MDDPLLVRRLERVGYLPRDRQRFIKMNRTGGKILALDQFHDQCGDTVAALDPVDRGDVRVVQRHEQFGFALKSREAFRVGGNRGRQHLERHRPLQIRIGGPMDFAHPAGTKRITDAIPTKGSAGVECHDGA